MINLFKNETLDASAPASYFIIDQALDQHNRSYRKKKIIFASTLVAVLLATFFYFILPVFQLSSLSLTGLVNLTSSDYLTLLGYTPHQSLLVYDASAIDQGKAKKVSQGLILSSSSKASPFQASAVLVEDYPFCRYGSEVYGLSGKNATDLAAEVSALPLSSERVQALASAVTKEANSQDLIQLHFQTAQTALETTWLSQTLTPYQGLAVSVTSYLRDIQFAADPSGSNKLTDVVAFDQTNGLYYIFGNVNTSDVPKLFDQNYFLETVLLSCRRSIAEKKTEKVTYTYADDKTSLSECYRFDASLFR
ncbi:MAG: hypothetical protein LKM30_08095 [Bacilli bacterium]|nr:hypothetical protein [Bacilli bacterium]